MSPLQNVAENPARAPAAELDRRLGDPDDAAAILSYVRCAELDRTEEFPDAICARLDSLGLPRYYVPDRHGGSLTSYEEVFHLMRVLARRDLTVAIAHGKTFLGAAGVWIAGTDRQAAALGAEILAGVPVSWGLTERAHGSDLLAGEVTARPVPGGYRIDGEKWLINNATRGRIVCVLARTEPAGGPRGFSLFLVDKRRLAAGTYRCLPKVATHGIRAADISGIVFDGAVVPVDSLVGGVGAGIEILLKAFQLTRTAAAALSLGAADHAVTLAGEFIAGRHLFGHRLLDLPTVRADLGETYAMRFVAEALGRFACRAIHALPGELSILSAVTKYLVPTLVDDLVAKLAELLGVRAFLADDHADGRFAKLERDHRIVAIFDGSAFVTGNQLVNQFPGIVRGHRRALGSPDAVSVAATLDGPLPAADLDGLSLVSRAGCSLTQSLRAAVAELAAAADPATGAARDLLAETEAVHRDLARVVPASRDVPPAAFALADRFALCAAGAACLQVWLRNRAPAGEETRAVWRDGRWLHAGLAYLLARLRPGTRPDRYIAYQRLVDAVAAGGGVGPLVPGAGA